MPRIPPEEIERIKREIPVQRLAEERGIKLKPQGKELVGLCIFHTEKTGSLHINPEKNSWHCFGCGKGGDNIKWVREAEGVSFRHAVEILREGGDLPALEGTSSIKPHKRLSTVPKLPSPVDFNAEDRELLRETVEFYHQTLKKSPEALSYLEKRGLRNAEGRPDEMIDHFKLGYANRTLGFRLPAKNRKTGAAIRERLTALGILRKTGHEHFSGCFIVSIFDDRGQVTEIYGRKISDDQRAGAIRHLYLPGTHKGVWNLEAFKASKEIILCEALIDALTFWNSGFRNVTASYGVDGFTPDHWETFRKYGVERVFIAYDNDNAGNTAAERLSRELIQERFKCFRVSFPRGMDANEYAQKIKPASKAFELAMKNAVCLA